jgi:hypothetical protein
VPEYRAPVYVAPYGYYGRREAILRHDEWVRAHRFDRDRDRDRDYR